MFIVPPSLPPSLSVDSCRPARQQGAGAHLRRVLGPHGGSRVRTHARAAHVRECDRCRTRDTRDTRATLPGDTYPCTITGIHLHLLLHTYLLPPSPSAEVCDSASDVYHSPSPSSHPTPHPQPPAPGRGRCSSTRALASRCSSSRPSPR